MKDHLFADYLHADGTPIPGVSYCGICRYFRFDTSQNKCLLQGKKIWMKSQGLVRYYYCRYQTVESLSKKGFVKFVIPTMRVLGTHPSTHQLLGLYREPLTEANPVLAQWARVQ